MSHGGVVQPDGVRPGWVLLLALVGVAAFQGSRGVYESTEGRYAECAREMVTSGNYLEPTLANQPHWTKPPLAYWAIAAGLKVFGIGAWGARAYLIPTFVLTVATVFVLGSLVWDPQAGRYSALVYATMPGPLFAANTVNTDSLLSLWQAVALTGFWWGVRTGRRSAYLVMWTALGAAFMTKGPPALLTLLVMAACYPLIKKTYPGTKHFASLGGIALFLGLGLSWYAWSVWHHPGLLSYWLGHEVVGRVFSDEFHRHPQWYSAVTMYWPILLGGILPWLVVVGVMAAKARKNPQPDPTVPKQPPKNPWARFRGFQVEWQFLILAFLLPLVVFSLSRSRQPLYVLPLFVPIALGIGKLLDEGCRKGLTSSRDIIRVAVCTTLIILAGKAVVAARPSPRNMRAVANGIHQQLAAADATRLYLFSAKARYGLDFYLHGNISHVWPTLAEEPPPGCIPLANLSQRISEDLDAHHGSALIMRQNHLDLAQRNLPTVAVHPRTLPLGKDWVMLVFDAS